MEPKKYATATSFRRALEDRLQAIAKKEGVDLQRVRRQVAFDRLLARLFQAEDPNNLPWVLKGGYAMELRMKAARATKDIDRTMHGVPGTAHTKGETEKYAVLAQLQEITARDCGDFFVYTVGEPISDLDAAPYGGARYPVGSRLDGRVFAGFHVDVGIGDAVMEPIETIKGRNWLEFAGIDSPSLYMIPREQQFAEKLHAYTLPRPGAVKQSRARSGGYGRLDSVRDTAKRRCLSSSTHHVSAQTNSRFVKGARSTSRGLGAPLQCAGKRVWRT